MIIHFFGIFKRYLIKGVATILLALCFIATKSYALKSNDIREICQASPAECLKTVNIELRSVKKKSRIWYSLMQFKLESLFILQHSDELLRETKRWIHDDDLPIAFQVTLYMYYAKSLLAYGDREEGKRYIYKAKQQLALMNDAYPSPIKLIEIANLQMYIGELPEAYESLNALKEKYKSSKNPHFMMELFGHLGHVARQLDLYNEALLHWEAAVPWSFKNGNEQQIATVIFNLAQIQQYLKQYSNAENNYLKAIKHAELALDAVKACHARLFLAEVNIIKGEKAKAEKVLSLIDEKLLTDDYSALYKALKNSIK
jgi:tetratricopeptide (TPR) repeat protein